MTTHDGFWQTTIASLTPVPFRLRRLLNFVDDTHSPMFLNQQLRAQNSVSSLAQPPTTTSNVSSSPRPTKTTAEKVADCLYGGETVDVDQLRRLSWSGIPRELRPPCWRILVGYLPNALHRHAAVLKRKRAEYRDIVEKYFGSDVRAASADSLDDAVKAARSRPALDLDDVILHQISIDVPRTCPECPLFQAPQVKESLLRILYCWSIRRPATGYVQGINDLVTPFYDVFISEQYNLPTRPTGSEALNLQIDEELLLDVEADTFWCLSNLLDSIQDNYTFNQSGIYRQVALLRAIALRMDPLLVNHLEAESVQFIQFAFRWMNCLLLREFRLDTIERLWDAYLAEGPDGFKHFHVYVCAAFLLKWRRELQLLEFQEVIVFLQTPPTAEWSDRDVEMLLAEAFVLKSLFSK